MTINNIADELAKYNIQVQKESIRARILRLYKSQVNNDIGKVIQIPDEIGEKIITYYLLKKIG